MIKRVGFESSPLDRLQLEFMDADVRVLEWLRGRTPPLPALFERDRAESLEMGLSVDGLVDVAAVQTFLQRLWEATGHMRCCGDPTRYVHL